jgi:hypothetical protein
MKKLLVMAVMLMAATSAQADLSINAFKQLAQGGKAQQDNVEMYVGGVVKGYLNVNGYLQSQKQPLLFCYSGDIDTGKALTIASEAVNEHLSTHPHDGQQEIVELLLMMKLKSLYPC